MTRADTEKRVVKTAMAEYRRMRALGIDRRTFGDGAQKHWDACAAHAREKRRRK